jgi:hypothetical protein
VESDFPWEKSHEKSLLESIFRAKFRKKFRGEEISRRIKVTKKIFTGGKNNKAFL